MTLGGFADTVVADGSSPDASCAPRRPPPDEKLPSEPELCERFGVSRITVRRAVADLEGLGIVRRQQGRGTFVAP
ncbi:hypothetical protein CTI14_54570, partial [Methylobacterium radiotolerans]